MYNADRDYVVKCILNEMKLLGRYNEAQRTMTTPWAKLTYIRLRYKQVEKRIK